MRVRAQPHLATTCATMNFQVEPVRRSIAVVVPFIACLTLTADRSKVIPSFTLHCPADSLVRRNPRLEHIHRYTYYNSVRNVH